MPRGSLSSILWSINCKISPVIHLLVWDFSKFLPLNGGLYLTSLEDVLAL